jgi:hypothetical protein
MGKGRPRGRVIFHQIDNRIGVDNKRVKPPRPEGWGFPVRKIKHFYIAPLDPTLKDGACGERAGQ